MIDYFADGLFLWRLLVVVLVLAVFYVLRYLRVLGDMPGGIAFVDHSEAIILLLFPLSWWTRHIWVTGIVLFLDDVVKHWRQAHGRPEYRSGIHFYGWYYLQRPVFKWFGIDTGG